MSSVLLAIKRLRSGQYEWFIVYGGIEYEHETGDEDITGCLQSAIDKIPTSHRLVEISYDGVHIGSFHRARVEKSPAAVANEVVTEFAYLINDVILEG